MPIRAEDFDVKGEAFVAPPVGVPGPRVAQVVQTAASPPAEPTERPASEKDVTSLAKTLERLQAETSVTTQNARLLADPGVRALLEARERGEEVVVVSRDELVRRSAAQTPAPQPVPPVELENMTNPQLAEYLTKNLSSTIAQLIEEKVGAAVKGVKDELSPTLQALALSSQEADSRRIQAEISDAQREFKDFDTLRPVMMELNKSVQGLSVKELYFLAKQRSGLPLVGQAQLETERPTEVPGQRKTYVRPAQTLGRNGFRSVLQAALGPATE